MMNLWPFIPAFAALLAGAAIFFLCPGLRRFHKFMGFTFVFEGLAAILNGALIYKASSFYLPSYLLYTAMLLTIPAFYYLAVQALLREERPHVKDLWMFLAALVFISALIPAIHATAPEDRDAFLMIQQGGSTLRTTGTDVLIAMDRTAYALYLAGYLFVQVFCILNITRYVTLLEDYYSDLDGKTMAPVAAILSLMGLRFLLLALSVFAPWQSVPLWLVTAQAVVSVLFYGTAAYSVCHIRHTAEELGRMAEIQAQKTKTPVADDVIGARLGRLEAERFYLEREVNLIDVATRVGVNSKYVSEFIRFHYGDTFMSYVNRLRIEASKEYLMDAGLSMEEIADRSGFANASTYYRNFMKITGVPPSKFRENGR